MNKIRTIIFLSAALLVASCSTRLTDFTVISSKNVEISRGAEFKRGRERVTGTDVKHVIIVIPTGRPDVKQALDRAIESTPGAIALVDGVISFHSWFVPLVYGRQWYEVEGTPLIDPKLLKE